MAVHRLKANFVGDQLPVDAFNNRKSILPFAQKYQVFNIDFPYAKPVDG